MLSVYPIQLAIAADGAADVAASISDALMTTNEQYLESQGVEKVLSQALSQVIRERPENALARLAELISPAPGATDNYLSTIGNTPMVKLGKMLPAECKAKAVYVKMGALAGVDPWTSGPRLAQSFIIRSSR